MEGFLVNANNRQVGPAYPYRIASSWADPYRAMCIRELLIGARGLTAADVARQQTDLHDLFAKRYLPHAVRAAELAGDSATARLLRGWNGVASADSRAAPVFYAWFELGRSELRAAHLFKVESGLKSSSA